MGPELGAWHAEAGLFAGGFRPGDVVIDTFLYHLVPAAHELDEALNLIGCAVVPTGVGKPTFEKLIYDDPKGLRHYRDPPEPRATRGAGAEGPGGAVGALRGDGSGDAAQGRGTRTTGSPKGAMIFHANLVSAIEGILQVEHYGRTDQMLAYLPPAWIGDSWSGSPRRERRCP